MLKLRPNQFLPCFGFSPNYNKCFFRLVFTCFILSSASKYYLLQIYYFLGFNCSSLSILVEINCKKLVRTGLDKLIHHIFEENEYNQLVRPVDTKTGLTHVSTELKFLQIDVVFFCVFLLIISDKNT